MGSMPIIVMLEIAQFRLQIGRCPEYSPVEILASNRTDQSFYERMGERHIGNGFDFRNLKYPQSGLPLVEPIQWIVIRAEVFRQTLPANRSIEGTEPPHRPCRCEHQTR